MRDRHIYRDELQQVSHLARTAPAPSLALLRHAAAETRQALPSPAAGQGEGEREGEREGKGGTAALEVCHWLLLMAGHVLCDDADSSSNAPSPPPHQLADLAAQSQSQEGPLSLPFSAALPLLPLFSQALSPCSLLNYLPPYSSSP